MSTVADPPPSDAADQSATGRRGTATGPDLNRLQDRTPQWLRMSRATAAWTCLVGMLYLVCSYQPLYHTDLWGHLAYGRWIWEHGRLPATEPLLPLSAGVPMVDTAWLSQVIGYGLYRQFGVTALQFLYAAPIAVSFALLLWGILRKTEGNVLAGVVGFLAFGWANYQQLLIVRPQLNGLLMFTTLLVLMEIARRNRWIWCFVPAFFVFWANLHGSWIVGLGLLATHCAGRAIDLVIRTRSLRTALSSRSVWRALLLTEIAAVAVLMNPYGFALYPEVFAISGHPNLEDLIEWKPLTLRMSQGVAAAVVGLILMITYRWTPRRVSATEVLLLAGLGGAALWSSRMIHWWSPVAAWYLAVHVAAIAKQRKCGAQPQPRRTGLMSVVTLGLIWIFFAYTPFGATVIHGRPEETALRAERFRKSTSPGTPLRALSYLRQHPVEGLIYNNYEWGDFLLFGGPRGIRLFTNSHPHLIPEEVWNDSLVIHHASRGWEDRLDRYGVNALVLSQQANGLLVRNLKRSTDVWEIALEDSKTVIFSRKDPVQ